MIRAFLSWINLGSLMIRGLLELNTAISRDLHTAVATFEGLWWRRCAGRIKLGCTHHHWIGTRFIATAIDRHVDQFVFTGAPRLLQLSGSRPKNSRNFSHQFIFNFHTLFIRHREVDATELHIGL